MKSKKCKVCKTSFNPFNTLQKVCGVPCSLVMARKSQEAKAIKEAKAEKRDLKARKDKLKTRSELAREVQVVFNRYIRLRDKGQPCISCGKPDDDSHQRHASHYRSVGSCSFLRFNELNVNASCAQCNNFMSGNISEYRISLIKKIGSNLVEWIECQPRVRKYSVDELRKIKCVYKDKVKALE